MSVREMSERLENRYTSPGGGLLIVLGVLSCRGKNALHAEILSVFRVGEQYTEIVLRLPLMGHKMHDGYQLASSANRPQIRPGTNLPPCTDKERGPQR